MLWLVSGCGGGGSVAASVSGLLDDADRARISIYDAAGFDCTLVFGPRPDPIVPRVVLPIGAMRTSIPVVPAGERILVIDLFDADGAEVGVGCSAVTVVDGETARVSVEINGYPEVLATDPTPDAMFVSPTEELRVVFSEAMDPATVPQSLQLARADGGARPTIRDAFLAADDGSERSWGIDSPFGLELGTTYELTFDDARRPRSKGGVPLRPFEGLTFTTDPLIDILRDLLPAVQNAVYGVCECPAAANIERVAEHFFLPGTTARVGLVPFKILETRFARDEAPFYEARLVTTSSTCERSVAQYNLIIEDAAARRCLFAGEVVIATEACFCADVPCDARPEVDRTDLSCVD